KDAEQNAENGNEMRTERRMERHRCLPRIGGSRERGATSRGAGSPRSFRREDKEKRGAPSPNVEAPQFPALRSLLALRATSGTQPCRYIPEPLLSVAWFFSALSRRVCASAVKGSLRVSASPRQVLALFLLSLT